MAGNSLGKEFVLTLFGESHGKCAGVVVDGCPAGLELREADVQRELDKRIPKGSGIVSSRIEEDKVEILSGTFKDRTTGAPIAMIVQNRDVDSRPYELIKDVPRPGHADYPAKVRYGGFNDYRGGGQFSGRMTAALVMAGAVAKKLLAGVGVEVLAYALSIGDVRSRTDLTCEELRASVYENPVRCGDRNAALLMEKSVRQAAESRDSLGGVVRVIAYDVPPGIGDPLFGSLDSELSQALFSIPAVKGVEFGSGFGAAQSKGSQNNDPLTVVKGNVAFRTNNAGGVLGGLSTGQEIVAQVAFKPTPSISRPQMSVDLQSMKETELNLAGRHDPCIVPKAVPVVEAMVSIVLADFMIRSGRILRILK
ncbi:chorismate synthase [Candidatus Bathyarchaeota archaeon]|nr:chorismate synthase [Candidatus Bathyarchaeota archaeon]